MRPPAPPLAPAAQTNATNPFNVGPIQQVVFQNLLCTMVPPTTAAAPAPTSPAAVQNPSLIEVQYTPVEYVDQPLVTSFTQFLIRQGSKKARLLHPA